ncbi:hypothetical protein QEZ48_08435 [Aquamicrobium lusatiense]|uniref:hypothetical protein n=1 Tax=Aquamicrobium lusatiense TaxID=89772 RepID=UPI00245376CA|nr:hypothetical protein [Aquamicrobium lusatiense]MDH4990857.1 hypothetical protein [Aquamicrobium lusatiense]
MTDKECEPTHAAAVDLINAAVAAGHRAVVAFRQEFGRWPDDRERRILVDACVDHFAETAEQQEARRCLG